MTRPDHPNQTEPSFLSVHDAEIVHGPDVIAEKISEALNDAERFNLPEVKPALSKALEQVQRTGKPGKAVDGQPASQDALAGNPAEVDEKAGSAELLKPDAAAGDS